MKGHVNTKNGEISIENQVIAKYAESVLLDVWYRRDGNGEYERWDCQAVNKR